MDKKAYMAGYMVKHALDLDLAKGDIVLTGKFKNKREEVTEIGTDDLGQPTVNGKKLLAVRIEKTMPKDMQSKATQELDNNE